MTATWPYDLTAEFYDEDMGLNADGRDVAWYLEKASAAFAALGDSVLELGCGTGRITLPLVDAGLSVVGVDRSAPMLSVLASKAGAARIETPRLIVADMARLPLAGRFSAILIPYSAFCYLVDDDDRDRTLQAVMRLLAPGGVLLMDLFVPDLVVNAATGSDILDYRRPLPAGWGAAVTLTRRKRVTPAGPEGVNRIERRYRFLDSAGGVVRAIDTVSLQRPYAPAQLAAVLTLAGLTDLTMSGDFAADMAAQPPARTAAIIARRGRS